MEIVMLGLDLEPVASPGETRTLHLAMNSS
jgi:hypothetical protein